MSTTIPCTIKCPYPSPLPWFSISTCCLYALINTVKVRSFVVIILYMFSQTETSTASIQRSSASFCDKSITSSSPGVSHQPHHFVDILYRIWWTTTSMAPHWEHNWGAWSDILVKNSGQLCNALDNAIPQHSQCNYMYSMYCIIISLCWPYTYIQQSIQ